MFYTCSMTRFLALVIIMVLLAPIGQSETLPGPIPADIVRVVDGDTIRVRAHIWPDQTLEIMVRLEGIDAPEIHRPQCRAERLIAEQAKTEVESVLEETVFLHNVHLGKYAGRVIAEARLSNGMILSDHLVSKGLAVLENTEDPWCVPATTPAPARLARP